jgi:hypothetical protein
LKQNAEALNVLQKGLEVVAEGDYGEEEDETSMLKFNTEEIVSKTGTHGSSLLQPSSSTMIEDDPNIKTDDVQPDGNFPHSQFMSEQKA